MQMYRQLTVEHNELQRLCAQPIVGGKLCAIEAETNRMNYMKCLGEKAMYLDKLSLMVPRSEQVRCDDPVEREKYLDEVWQMAERLWETKTGTTVPVSVHV